MPTHQLVVEKSRPPSAWVLAWDDRALTLTGPDGLVAATASAAEAHRLVALPTLFTEGKVQVGDPPAHPPFASNAAAVADLRALVGAGLRADPVYREEVVGAARRAVAVGAALFAAGVVPFGLFCWYASWAEDPPPGHWLRSFGWLIKLGMFGLLGLLSLGLSMAYGGAVRLRSLGRLARD